MMLPIKKGAGSTPLLLDLALCTGGEENIQTPSQALQEQIVQCIDMAVLRTCTGETFIQGTNMFLPDMPPPQLLPVLHSLHSCC